MQKNLCNFKKKKKKKKISNLLFSTPQLRQKTTNIQAQMYSLKKYVWRYKMSSVPHFNLYHLLIGKSNIIILTLWNRSVID